MKSQEMTSLGAGRENDVTESAEKHPPPLCRCRRRRCPTHAPLYLPSSLYILCAILLSRSSRLQIFLSTNVLMIFHN